MIIDCHCHAGHGDGLTAPWDTAAPLAAYRRRAARAGIECTVLFAAFHSDYAVANAEVARIVAARPDCFVGFAFVNPVADRGRVHALVRVAVEEYGFCGIKAHRAHGDLTREICEVARAFGIPVLYDVMGKVSSIEMFAPSYRDVMFIIPHLGSFAGDWRAHLGTIDQLVRHPNVHADSSAVQRFDFLVDAVRRAGSRKLLFGTDGPWTHPAVELAKIRELHLPAAEEALVLGGNLSRLVAPALARARVRRGARATRARATPPGFNPPGARPRAAMVDVPL